MPTQPHKEEQGGEAIQESQSTGFMCGSGLLRSACNDAAIDVYNSRSGDDAPLPRIEEQ